MKTSPDTSATAFRAIRTQLGLSRAALAGKLGISPDYVMAMERGIRPISTRTFMALEHLTCATDCDCGHAANWHHANGCVKPFESGGIVHHCKCKKTDSDFEHLTCGKDPK